MKSNESGSSTSRRIELTNVQIRKSTHRRLREHRDKQFPRPSMADLATIAVDQYLDRAEQDERRAQLEAVKGE